MTEQGKNGLKYWLIGLFSGTALAAPITAVICKKIYKQQGYENGLNDMAAYAAQQVVPENKPAQIKAVEPSEDDINDYDLSIDDVEATEEARVRTEAHEKYLDMIDKYSGDEVLKPRMISPDEFINEQYMEKSYINWYEQDNVFEEDLSVIEDPYATFGVTNGRELFKNADLRPDPDICYVRNEKNTTDFEISRIHGSYAKMVGGEASLGETDT